MTSITLEKMEFYAFHGCLEHEKTIGNVFELTVTMYFDTYKAGESDRLEDTVNYKHVYDLVKQEMEVPSELIEHVAWRIIKTLKNRFSEVNNWKLSLSKKNPPLGGTVERVRIDIEL